jgi:hypothetical protein
VLADRLAALVKGKPEEMKAAAEKLGAQGPTRRGRAGRLRGASRGGFRPWMLFAGFGMLIGLVSVIGGLLRQPPAQAPAVQNDRTAFFGFSSDAGGLPAEVAAAATEETRTALNNLGLETAAPGDTQGVKLEEQLPRAAALNARYSLAGNVLASGDTLSVTIRLDDTQLRSTLWQTTLTGGAAQRESLPVQAAAKASYLLQCLILVRPDMAREDAAALGLVTRACEPASGFDPQGFVAWREVVRVAPKSVYAEFQNGGSWFFEAATAPVAERPAMIAQGRAAFQRARALDPASPMPRGGLAMADIASERPLAELLEEINAAIAVGAETSTLKGITIASAYRVGLLSSLGRNAEAARLGRADAAADPLNLNLQAAYAAALGGAGQSLESRRVMAAVNRRLADPVNWSRYASFEIASRGDLAPLLSVMPPGVSPETVACLQEAARAVPLRDVAIRKAAAQRIAGCLRAGATQPGMSISLIASLGDVDTAFAILDRIQDRSSPLTFVQTGSSLFFLQSAPLRADPRFLPLVKKVGIYQYWLDTRTQPDVCDRPEERDIEVCRELRKDQGR